MVLLRGTIEEGLYKLSASTTPPQALHASISTAASLWHSRFGHPSKRITNFLLKQINPKGPSPISSNFPCQSCSWAKAHSLPHPTSNSRSTRPFSLLFTDVWGLAHLLSKKENRYYLSIVDDFTKFIWLFPLSTKSLVTSTIINFIKLVTNQFSTTILSIQTDGGSEFKPLKQTFQALSISHRLTCPYSHQQNGSVESRHRRIVDMGLTLL